MTREPGQGRRDLRAHTRPGALNNSHRKKGCGKAAVVVLLAMLGLPSAVVWAGYQLAATVFGGGA